ncbi:rhamnogalacturonan lyase family protein [Microbacterium sp. NPDC055683]
MTVRAQRRLRTTATGVIGIAALVTSAVSATGASATTAEFRFDFGGPASPVADGWTQIAAGTTYSAAAGYGFVSGGTTFRDRAAGDPMLRDFVNGAWEFVVDLPSGTYEVTTWSGDLTAGNTTDLTVEGTVYNSRTSAGSVDERISTVEVLDGRLNIVGGRDGRINGVLVRSPLAAPAALAADVDVSDEPSVSVSWDAVAEATRYEISRSSEGGVLERVAETSEPRFVDDDVLIGDEYDYSIRAFSEDRESEPSATLAVRVVDESVAAPVAPTGLTVASIAEREVALSWDGAAGVRRWKVYRTTREDIPFELVGSTTDPTWTDADVLTTRPYLYRVAAVGDGGASETSETIATEITTTLVRDMEYLDRAPVAVALEDGVYIGWRLLGLDDRELPFNVYRDDVRINEAPLVGATNFVDPAGAPDSEYRITALVDGREVSVTDAFGAWGDQYTDIPLEKPEGGVTPAGESYTYYPGDASVGDVDGDGAYEIVLLWNPSNSKDNSQSGYTGNVLMDAYEIDGTRLWRMDLGVNIRAGAHYTQFQVYDLDGDGRAEVSFRTADGTVDGAGAVIGDAAADHRNTSGYILSGPEYLTVFDGQTGAALDTVEFAPERGEVAAWGDTYGNRVDRFLAGVGYFDGEHPSLLFSRGYYTRAVLVAWDFRDGELVERWTFDSDEWGDQYEEQGNHNLTTADVDRDGLDEVVYGAMTIDDDGSPLYNTRLLHGDTLNVGDHVTDRPGLEIFSTFENQADNGGVMAAMRDAETGDILWKSEGPYDTGRGGVADIDPRHAGAEAWHPSTGAIQTIQGLLRTAHGDVVSTVIPDATYTIYWDGDPLRELVAHEYDPVRRAGPALVSKWDPATDTQDILYRADGTLTNGTQAQPLLQADLLGDWHEELLLRHEDGTALRLLTTVAATDLRIPTLMHDPQYRQSVAWQNTAYNQPPRPGFFIGEGMSEPPTASIAYVAAPEADTTPPAISAVPTGTLADSQTLDPSSYAVDEESGIRSLIVEVDGEQIDPDALFDLEERIGEHVIIVTATNHAGLTASQEGRFLVVRDDGATAAPGRGVLSHTSGRAYGLHDGNYDVVMNLWRGTPGSVLRLYENGELIETKALPFAEKAPQAAGFRFEGKPNGTYVYTAELINLRGATETTSTTVKVTSALPGKPVVSHDNGDRDGAFTLTANMWWGVNATEYRFELDGQIVGSGALTAATPAAQHASVSLTGIPAGVHSARAIFFNAFGETASAPVTVEVRS